MSQIIDLLIKNGSCFVDNKLQKVDLAVSNSKIQEIGDLKNLKAKETIDAEGLTVLPGVIDTQVHFREPGSTDVEDLKSGSKAQEICTIEKKNARKQNCHLWCVSDVIKFHAFE